MQEAAKKYGIPFKAIHITDKESAQNVPAPVTTYALFRDGQFLTQSIQSDKKFLALAGLQNWFYSAIFVLLFRYNMMLSNEMEKI